MHTYKHTDRHTNALKITYDAASRVVKKDRRPPDYTVGRPKFHTIIQYAIIYSKFLFVYLYMFRPTTQLYWLLDFGREN